MILRNRSLIILIWLMLVVLIVSCETSNRKYISNSSVMTVATLNSYPTHVSVFDYSDQVTDGKVLLSVEEIDNNCRKINETFQIRFVFTNLTDSPIRMSNDVSIAVNRHGDGGTLNPFITFEDGRDIYKLGDATFVDIFKLPLDAYTQIPGETSIDFVVESSFPELVVEIPDNETINYVTPMPGQYFIRFVYSIYDRNPDVWQETISSNKLAICIAY